MNKPTFTFRISPALRGQSVSLRSVDLYAFFKERESNVNAAFASTLENPAATGSGSYFDAVLHAVVDLVNAGIDGPWHFYLDADQIPQDPYGTPKPGHLPAAAIDKLEGLGLLTSIVNLSGGTEALLHSSAVFREAAARQIPEGVPGRESGLFIIDAVNSLARSLDANNNSN